MTCEPPKDESPPASLTATKSTVLLAISATLLNRPISETFIWGIYQHAPIAACIIRNGGYSFASSIATLIISIRTPWLPSRDSATPQITTRCSSPSSPSSPWLRLTTSALVQPRTWTCHGCRCCKFGRPSRGGRVFNKGCIGCQESLIAKVGTGNMICRLGMLLILFCAFEGIRYGSLLWHLNATASLKKT